MLSDVAQISNLLYRRIPFAKSSEVQAPWSFLRPADWKSAIQQTGSLRYNKAFTLIEVLLAIAIFSIVLAAINGVFFASLHLQMATRGAIEEALPADHAATVIKQDIANIVLPGSIAQSTSGGLGSTAPVTAGAGMANPVSLEIFTSGGSLTDDNPWCDLQKVDYSLQESLTDKHGKDLVRSVTRNLLASTVETPIHQRLLENVEKLKISFYDGTNWLDVWAAAGSVTTATNAPVPAAIRVEITRTDSTIPIDLMVPVMTAYPVVTNQ